MPKPAGHDELDVDAVLAGYDVWLTRQPLAARTRDAYLAQVRDFVTWLAGSEHGAGALGDPDVRDWAVRDYKRYVKTTKRSGPALRVSEARADAPTTTHGSAWRRETAWADDTCACGGVIVGSNPVGR